MFTQSCFIRKNSPEIREKLKELGYHVYDLDMNKDSPADWCTVIESEADYVGIWCKEPANKEKFLDCGTNEELFLALAALRDDTDAYQWFVNEIGNVWWRTEFDSFLECFIESNEDSELKYEDFHKATPEELIKHFKHG
jgi:hypothetical protein